MNEGSKYFPLFDHLQRADSDEVIMSIDQIESLLEKPLPNSARTNSGWWSNRGRGAVQAAAWMAAGYHTINVDLERQLITFRRPTAIYAVEWEGDTVRWDAALIRTLRYHMGSSQAEFAETLGVRQQTISEWETGMYRPKRAMSKYLMIVAERAGFTYGEEPDTDPSPQVREN